LAERRRESHILQVFLFAGGFRHCERSEAIHLAAKEEDGLLRRFAPRNDGKTLNSFVVWHHLRRFCFTMRRIRGRGLSSGTSPERIAPESVTRMLSGFVHRNISRGQLICGTRSSLARLDKGRCGGEFLKGCENNESNQKSERVKRIQMLVMPGQKREARLRARCPGHPRLKSVAARKAWMAGTSPAMTENWIGYAHHCVLATRGGVACVMNWVASSMAVPNGVGITIRNGTRMRVPATGAKAISMLRWAARYLITGRSGM